MSVEQGIIFATLVLVVMYVFLPEFPMAKEIIIKASDIHLLLDRQLARPLWNSIVT